MGDRRPVDEGESTDVGTTIVSFEDDHVLVSAPLHDEVLKFGAEAIAHHGHRFRGRGAVGYDELRVQEVDTARADTDVDLHEPTAMEAVGDVRSEFRRPSAVAHVDAGEARVLDVLNGEFFFPPPPRCAIYFSDVSPDLLGIPFADRRVEFVPGLESLFG